MTHPPPSPAQLEALAALDAERKKNPHPDIYLKMAEIFSALGMESAALPVLGEATRRFPDDVRLQAALARHYYRNDEPEKGLGVTAPLIRKPECPEDLVLTHAALLKAANRAGEAREFYEKLLKKNPKSSAALAGLAGIFSEAGEKQKAETLYREALQAAPLHTHIRTQLAALLLQQGKLGEGFDYYQSRFGAHDADEHATVKRRPFPQPLWDGGKKNSVLIWNEQGVGEEILYASMLKDAAARANIVAECDARLLPLFQRSFPEIMFTARTTPPDAALLKAEAQIPAGHLGSLFRRDLQSFPKAASYLVADPAKTAQLRQRYAAQLKPGGHIIGISWRSQKLRHGDPKSTRLEDWAPLMQSIPHLFVSLQHGDTAGDIAAAKARGWNLIEDTGINQQTSLDDFAAQIAAMDAVITVSNSTAHMAGALGKKAAVLLPRSKGLMWHWFDQGETSPWYPSLKLLRQEKEGDWAQALKSARTFLDFI